MRQTSQGRAHGICLCVVLSCKWCAPLLRGVCSSHHTQNTHRSHAFSHVVGTSTPDDNTQRICRDSKPTTRLKLDNKCVQKMKARVNVTCESALLPLWSDFPPCPSSTRPNPPCCKQHGWSKRTERGELPQRRVTFQITGHNGPSLAHAPLATNEKTLRDEAVRITCTRVRHTNKCRCACNMMCSPTTAAKQHSTFPRSPEFSSAQQSTTSNVL